jgi:TPR repeat protein
MRINRSGIHVALLVKKPFMGAVSRSCVGQRLAQRGWFALMGSLVMSAAMAQAADNGCKAAYDDGARSADVSRCEAAARAGGPNAEFEYGLLLWSGHNGVNDKHSALDWFRLSARQGHYLAQVMLGKMLSDTRVDATLRNPVEAYAWFVAASAPKAAEKVMSTLNATDARAAEVLSLEYRAKYGKARPALDGP